MITEEDLIYFAGFFDGDGCITISKHLGKEKPHFLALPITSKNKEILNWIQSKFGGHVLLATNGYWHWNITCSKARDLLIKLYPYLKVKRKQAKYAVIFENLKRIGFLRNEKGQFTRLSSANVELREKIKQKISTLNRS